MPQIFVPFPFSLPDVLADLTDAPAAAQPAMLQDYRLVLGQHVWLPLAQPAPGQALEGVLMPLTPMIEMLTTKLGWVLLSQTVVADGEAQEAMALMPGADWDTGPLQDLGNWQMALFGQVWAELYSRPPVDVRPRLAMMLARATARLAAKRSPPTELRSDINAARVQDRSAMITHDGFFQYRQIDLRHPLFDGGHSPLVTREVFVATDAAIVLPYDPKRDRVLLVEQFRMGPYERSDPHPFCLEPVAGRVDGGEHPETTARRECIEEARLNLYQLEHISSHYASPGASTEFFHCYLGLCDLPELVQGAGGLEDEDEDIRTHVIPFEAANDLIRTGEANIGPLVTTLLWLERERPRLRANA